MGWEGWRVGMSGPTVATAKSILRVKFSSYAGHLDTSQYFSEDLQRALAEYQTRKNASNHLGLRTDGVLDWATQLALGVIAPNPPTPTPTKGVILTCQGTGADMWTGYPADTARAVADVFTWQPIGNWPASPFPMRPSYRRGIEELVVQCRRHAGRPKVLAGYSQGAIVTSRVWRDEISKPGGRLYDLRREFVGAVTWGNPDREQGKANGNLVAGWPVPEGPGITGDNLRDTPDWWLDFAHGANSQWGRDMYTDASTKELVLLDQQAIWRLIESVDLIGRNSLLERIVNLLERPVIESVAMFQAIYDAGAFFLSKPFATYAHCSYEVQPAVDWLRQLARTL